MAEFSVETDPAFRLAALVRTAGYRARCPNWTDEFPGAAARVLIWMNRGDYEAAAIIVRFETDGGGTLVKWNGQESRTTEPHDLWVEIRATIDA